MSVQTAAGSRLFIGTTAANPATDTFDEVAEVVNFGEFGKTFNVIRHNPVATRRTKKFKGAYDEGNIALQLGRDIEDDGQAAMKAALDSDESYNFKITLNDAPAGSGATPTTFAFKGKVVSYTTNIQSVDNIVGANCTIEIDSEITETPAEA